MLFSLNRNRFALFEYENKYKGENVIIVGSGPTDVDYSKLAKFNCCVIFINDTIVFERYVKDKETFLVTHHPEKFMYHVQKSTILTPLKAIMPNFIRTHKMPNLNKKQIIHNVVHVWAENELSNYLSAQNAVIKSVPEWAKNRKEVAKRGELIGHFGSVTTAIHFAWYCGFNHIMFVGCNPIWTESHRHDERIQKFGVTKRKGSAFDLKNIIENQKKILEIFNISHEYIGDNYNDIPFL